MDPFIPALRCASCVGDALYARGFLEDKKSTGALRASVVERSSTHFFIASPLIADEAPLAFVACCGNRYWPSALMLSV